MTGVAEARAPGRGWSPRVDDVGGHAYTHPAIVVGTRRSEVRESLNAASLRQGLSLEEFIACASGAGFEGIEVPTAAATTFVAAHGLVALQARLRDAGLGVAGFGYPVPLRATDAEFAAGLAAAPAACELAVALGAAGGAAGLPWRQGEGYTVTPAQVIDRIGQLGRLAARYGLGVYLEFIALHPPGSIDWTKTLGQTLDLIEAVGLPNVGVLIDSYHWHMGRSDARDLARVPAGMPILLHINDAPPGVPEELDDSMRVLPGAGVMDLPGWLRAIRAATGYDGYVSVELFSEELRALDPHEAARRCKQALDNVLARIEGGDA
jgi:2-keto-myo-inositol isomerase